MDDLRVAPRLRQAFLLLLDPTYGLHEVVPDLDMRFARAQVFEVLALHPILLPDGVHGLEERLNVPVSSDARTRVRQVCYSLPFRGGS